MPETERHGVYTRLKGSLTSTVDLFAEFGYRNISTTQQLAPAPIEGDVENIVAPATNPFNPFGKDAFFRYRVTEAGPRIDDITTDAYRALVGLDVELPGDWNLESGFLYSETDSQDTTNNNLSRSAVIAALNDPDPATSLTSSAPATTLTIPPPFNHSS